MERVAGKTFAFTVNPSLLAGDEYGNGREFVSDVSFLTYVPTAAEKGAFW